MISWKGCKKKDAITWIEYTTWCKEKYWIEWRQLAQELRLASASASQLAREPSRLKAIASNPRSVADLMLHRFTYVLIEWFDEHNLMAIESWACIKIQTLDGGTPTTVPEIPFLSIGFQVYGFYGSLSQWQWPSKMLPRVAMALRTSMTWSRWRCERSGEQIAEFHDPLGIS